MVSSLSITWLEAALRNPASNYQNPESRSATDLRARLLASNKIDHRVRLRSKVSASDPPNRVCSSDAIGSAEY